MSFRGTLYDKKNIRSNSLQNFIVLQLYKQKYKYVAV